MIIAFAAEASTTSALAIAIIIGFNVRPDNIARVAAEEEKVDMRLYRVIYDAIEDIEKAIIGMLDPEYEEETREITALINPEIIASYGSFISEDEGCLSVVDYRANVKRYERVTVKALNIDGKQLEFDAEGILSVIMQHEIDHLDGILFIDRISSLKRAMYKKKRMKELKNQ